MKKILLTAFICTMILTFTACSSTANEISDDTSTEIETNTDNDPDSELETEDGSSSVSESEDETIADNESDSEANEVPDSDPNDHSLESLIDTIYTATGLELPMLMTSPLTKDNQAYMLGVNNFDFIEGFASEPMINAQAHSVVLLTVEDSLDIEAIKEDIKANVNGYKWICVGIEPENIIVDSKDNMIILIMDDDAATIHEAFLATAN
jgi:hypothetical protein